MEFNITKLEATAQYLGKSETTRGVIMNKLSISDLEIDAINNIAYNGNFGRLQYIAETKKAYYSNLLIAELITKEQYTNLVKRLFNFVSSEFMAEALRLNKML